ncbi:TIGR03557 family F420-dependent LLM class oxidoreductase [Actinomadura parmotrematis]|uniref:TIGR03557 family F420-dependent LLM class oxidoreductase n=1 Tax=Actinomadura parmotrematis TaxID=2864039 RepID=A0ABS7G214_9ACTN|nr:TIGR03557 family F420-dependent LLM class oxidoreductase [Actinomadura parmotrematis]MBW8486415.1 TIGR03557 family F420-dependent LLM class oxidoreductase [Actinomadura parmotrematis]
MRIGYKLFAEAYDPKEIVRQAVEAERAGFDFVEISDHYHPWLESHGHSGFAWSILAAIAARTEKLEIMTGVTCPFVRYHPAIIAQAAATTQILSDGRFTLGVGSGERLNEHVVGGGWPSASVRHEMFVEALEIIRLLWGGGYQSYEGQHLELEDARVFDLPDALPPIVVAAGGKRAAGIAAELGDGMFNTVADAEVVQAYTGEGGKGPKYCEVPVSWAPDEKDAVASAHRLMRFGLSGWKVQAELPNVVNFEAASTFVTEDDIRENVGCGPDPETHLAAARKFVDAGFDTLTLMNSGPDPDGFLRFYADELAGPIKALRA